MGNLLPQSLPFLLSPLTDEIRFVAKTSTLRHSTQLPFQIPAVLGVKVEELDTVQKSITETGDEFVVLSIELSSITKHPSTGFPYTFPFTLK